MVDFDIIVINEEAAVVESSRSRAERVIRLLSDYCGLIDSQQAQAWAALFAPGASLLVRDRRIQGADDLLAFAASSPAGVHITGVPSIEATMSLTFGATSPFTFVRADGAGLLAGYYHDTIADDGVGARFVERRVEMISALAPAGN